MFVSALHLSVMMVRSLALDLPPHPERTDLSSAPTHYPCILMKQCSCLTARFAWSAVADSFGSGTIHVVVLSPGGLSQHYSSTATATKDLISIRMTFLRCAGTVDPAWAAFLPGSGCAFDGHLPSHLLCARQITRCSALFYHQFHCSYPSLSTSTNDNSQSNDRDCVHYLS